VTTVAGALALAGPSGAASPVQLENQRAGSGGWEPLITRITQDKIHGIEGYSSQVSVLPGGTVQLHVSTSPAARYRVEVYRLGWYGGAGGRLIGCLPSCDADEQGVAQPLPPPPDPVTRIVRAGWPVTDSFVVPLDAVSGYYSFKLLLTSGPLAGQSTIVPVIVRAPAGQNATILVQASVNTWQAYNGWGGKSLYSNSSSDGIAANHVSFDRPYDSTFFPRYEINLVRFLEREGYDVSYTTDVDTQRDPAELTRHRLVIVSGHDEYWTKEMRDAFEAARGAGINLAFMGADIGDWQMRYEDGERTIVEYRDAALDPILDPALDSVHFADLVPPRPPCTLLGIQYQNGLEFVIDPLRDYTVSAAGDPWFAGTGFTSGSILPGAVGYEWDAVQPGCAVPAPTVLFHYEGAPSNGDAVRYTAPSGARVFSTGSLNFVSPLDPYPAPPDGGDPRLQQFMRNVLADLTGASPAAAAPVVVAAPALGGSAVVGKPLTVDSTGTWGGAPTGYSYGWLRCDPDGGNCVAIGAAVGPTYTVQLADVGSSIRAEVTATNQYGSTPSRSDPSGSVQASGTSFGTSTVQVSVCPPGPDVVDANGPFAVGAPLTVTEAHGYLVGGVAAQRFRVAVYADAGGQPGALLGTSAEVVVSPFQPASWVRFAFPQPILVPAGSYWLAYWFGPTAGGSRVSCTQGVAGIERYTGAAYSTAGDAPASWPAGSGANSRYALFAGSGDTAPTSIARPGISGPAVSGQALTASHGIWTNSPIGFAYQWRRCDSTGANCVDIAGATGQTYVAVAADVGRTITVFVTASNTAGWAGAASAPTAVVQSGSPPVTLGTTSIGSFTNTGGGNFLDSSGPYTLAQGGALLKLSGFLQGGDVAQGLRVAVYADSGGAPGPIVAVSGEVVVAAHANASWVDFPIAGAPALPPGRYWLAYWYGGSSVQEYYDVVPGGGRYAPASYAPGGNPPSPFPGGSGDSVGYSLYASLSSVSPPANTALPAIAGTPMQGKTLSASNGSWTGSPTGFAYQWRRRDQLFGTVCNDIAGATAGTYVAQAADIGQRLRVVVTAANAGGSAAATSSATAAVQAAVAAPVNTSQPTISGTLKQGQTLTATKGAWSGAPASFAYQWRRCDQLIGIICTDIAGATAATYVQQAADIGQRLRVAVAASNAGGSAVAVSAPTGVVLAAVNAPVNTALPVVSGNAMEGQTLTASTGSWNGSPTSFAYQWRQCDARTGLICADIAGATSASYALQAADVGKKLRVVVAAQNPGGSTAATSKPTGTVEQAINAPANLTPPGISGTARQGQTLTAANGSWSGGPTSFAFQWRRCDGSGADCAAIGGATLQRYVLQAADIGSTLRVSVTARNAGGSAAATSAQTALVQPNVTGSTLGKTTIGVSQAKIAGGGLIVASGPYTLPVAAQVTKLTGYVGGTESAQPLRTVIYADNGANAPGALVAVSSPVTLGVNARPALVDFTFGQLPSLAAGKYWLGFWSGGSVFVFFDTVGGAGSFVSAPYSSTANPPASFGGGTGSALALTLFATLRSTRQSS
jgi:hypothetical protein